MTRRRPRKKVLGSFFTDLATVTFAAPRPDVPVEVLPAVVARDFIADLDVAARVNVDPTLADEDLDVFNGTLTTWIHHGPEENI